MKLRNRPTPRTDPLWKTLGATEIFQHARRLEQENAALREFAQHVLTCGEVEFAVEADKLLAEIDAK